MYAWTDNPEAICPLNFFKAGGVKNNDSNNPRAAMKNVSKYEKDAFKRKTKIFSMFEVYLNTTTSLKKLSCGV